MIDTERQCDREKERERGWGEKLIDTERQCDREKERERARRKIDRHRETK